MTKTRASRLAALVSRADRVVTMTDDVGRRTVSSLRTGLRSLDDILGRRVRAAVAEIAPLSAPISGAAALAARASARAVIALGETLLVRTQAAQSAHSADAATREFARSIEILSTGNARLEPQPAERPSLLRQHEASARRYGVAMTREIEECLAVGLSRNLTQAEMVSSLSGRFGDVERVVQQGEVVSAEHAERRGIFTQYRGWAERIVRTETSFAYNAQVYESLLAAARADPRVRKKIIATFDARTGEDSKYVHGQIRAVNETFLDGAGRVYLMPPARPNDREIVIAWMDGWPENTVSRSHA